MDEPALLLRVPSIPRACRTRVTGGYVGVIVDGRMAEMVLNPREKERRELKVAALPLEFVCS